MSQVPLLIRASGVPNEIQLANDVVVLDELKEVFWPAEHDLLALMRSLAALHDADDHRDGVRLRGVVHQFSQGRLEAIQIRLDVGKGGLEQADAKEILRAPE